MTLCRVFLLGSESSDLPSACTRAGLASAGASTLWQRRRAGNSILLILLRVHISDIFQGEDRLYSWRRKSAGEVILACVI